MLPEWKPYFSLFHLLSVESQSSPLFSVFLINSYSLFFSNALMHSFISSLIIFILKTHSSAIVISSWLLWSVTYLQCHLGSGVLRVRRTCKTFQMIHSDHPLLCCSYIEKNLYWSFYVIRTSHFIYRFFQPSFLVQSNALINSKT